MLNRAHFLHRQAEKAARKGNVEEAIQVRRLWLPWIVGATSQFTYQAIFVPEPNTCIESQAQAQCGSD